MSDPAPHAPGPRGTLTLTERELFDRLGWFTHVRWAFGLFCLFVLLIKWHVIGVRLRVGQGPYTVMPAVRVVLILFLYNAAFTFLVRIVRARGRVSIRLIELTAGAQILCDLLAICALIHYTGGVENAFLILVLVPIVIVSELLPRSWAYLTAAGATVLLNALAWCEQQGVIAHVQATLVSRAGHSGPALYADPYYVLNVTAALTATIFAMVFVATTIAARLRKREAQLDRAYRQLHLADEAKGFFMRRAGHEMRAPLTAIHSVLDALAFEENNLTDRQLHLLDRAKDRAKAMIELVGDLRRYARLRSPVGFRKTDALPLGRLISHTVDLFRPQARDRQIDLRCRVEPVHIRGNEEMLHEVVTNLVANALQYTPRGGRVDVDLVRDGPAAVLTVRDTGIGISESAKASLFDEFYRAPEAKEFFHEGTGLGLAIVKRIVDVHDGQVTADSPPAGGAVFAVRLPIHTKVARRSARRGDEADAPD